MSEARHTKLVAPALSAASIAFLQRDLKAGSIFEGLKVAGHEV